MWAVYNFTLILRYCTSLYQYQTSAKLTAFYTFTRLLLYDFTATKYHKQCDYFILSQTYGNNVEMVNYKHKTFS